MSNRHEPRDAFVTQLEDRLRTDLARSRPATPPAWMPRSRLALSLALAAIVAVSMGIGGGVVAVAYQAQENALRNMLVATYEQRAGIAEQRVALARQQLQELESRATVGLESRQAVRDARSKVIDAEAELRVLVLDLAEVRATGREPMKTVSAPLVSGRDFVGERLQVELSVPAAALEAATLDVEAARTRFNVGLANPVDVEAAAARQIELESALELAQKKIGLRKAFLSGGVSPAAADLRVLEAETEQRRSSLTRRIEFAQRQLRDLGIRKEIGTVSPLEVAEAEMRILELELAMKKADYELALIRQKLGK